MHLPLFLHSGQLDTPLHTATLLSMIKMAQQLAVAEATLQEQEEQLQEQLRSSMQAQMAAQQSDVQQDSSMPTNLHLDSQACTHLAHAAAAAAVLAGPSLSLLQLCRLQSPLQGRAVPRQLGLWVDATNTSWFRDEFSILFKAAALQQHHDKALMVGTLRSQVGACAVLP